MNTSIGEENWSALSGGLLNIITHTNNYLEAPVAKLKPITHKQHPVSPTHSAQQITLNKYRYDNETGTTTTP